MEHEDKSINFDQAVSNSLNFDLAREEAHNNKIKRKKEGCCFDPRLFLNSRTVNLMSFRLQGGKAKCLNFL